MFILSCIIAGISGTFLMTLFTRLGSRLTGYNFHVPTILGSMVTMSTRPSGKPSDSAYSLAWGYSLHYGIGIAFSLIYARIYPDPDHFTNYLYALAFGAVAGLVAVTFWFCFLKLHPRAPKVRLDLYLLLIFLGHLIFALGMNAAFHLIIQLSGTLRPA